MSATRLTVPLLLATAALGAGGEPLPEVEGIELIETTVTSTADGSEQPVIIGVPDGYDEAQPTPLLVGLHTWSADYRQRAVPYGLQAAQRGWLLVLPNSRGPNRPSNPHAREAGGSIIAQRDIVDARAFMVERFNVDLDRVFITGDSGGGHMTLLMVGKHPELWSAAAAWVPITCLHEWWSTRPGRRPDLVAITGGEPGDSPQVDFEYARRSPRTFITNLAHVPVLLGHGDRDALIPAEQSWETFRILKDVPRHRTLFHVFSGGHTGLQGFGLDWCAEHARPLAVPRRLDLVTDDSKSYYWADLRMADENRLARATVVLGDDTLSVETANLRGISLQLGELSLPEDGLTLALRAAEPLALTLEQLPEGAQISGDRAWWRTEEALPGTLKLIVQPAEEMRALRIAW